MRLGCCFTIGVMKGKGQTAHTYKPVILQVRSDKISSILKNHTWNIYSQSEMDLRIN